MTLKSPVETQEPRVANHYIVEPVSSPSAAVSINERSPLAPPRSKDAKKLKSATLPNPKKSAPIHKPAPYRPPPPKFTSTSAVPSSPNSNTASPTASISAPPRKKKSVVEEHVYEAPIVNQSTSVSSDTVKEAEECYVDPAEYLEICELPSPADGNSEPKTNENSASTSSTASKEDDKVAVTVKSAVTDIAKTSDENLSAHNSLMNHKAKEPADSTDAKEKEQNLTILQAKKMFEAKPQSPSSNNKVMSPTSKVIKTGSSESTNETKPVTTEQKPEAMDSSNTPSSIDNDLPRSQSTPIQPEASESMSPKQEKSFNMADNKSEDNAVNKNKVDDVQGSKNLVPAKPSKPAVAKKPHITLNGGNQ